MQRIALIIVLMAVAGCGGTTTVETFSEVNEADPSFAIPESDPQPVIEGLDGQAFMDALEAEGFVCGEPQEFTVAVNQWNCSAQATDVEGVLYEVIILGASPDAIHSIDASVDQLAAPAPDPALSHGFLSFVAGAAGFTGADTAAAQQWIAQNATSDSAQVDVAGVTYNLRGPAGLRALEIVAVE